MVDVRALKLKDEHYGMQWFDEVENRWNYTDFKKSPKWRKGWISMDCAYYNCEDQRVYLGITSFDADIFKAYDCKTEQFIDLGYQKIADQFDAKFHRSLVKGDDNCLYAAVALLHDSDEFLNAPGGAIVKYNPQTKQITKLTIPVKHAYIQSIAIDNERKTIYGQCLAPEYAFKFDLKTNECEIIGLLGSGYGGMAQGENITIDKNGCVWFTWSVTRAWQSSPGCDAIRLCKYDPDTQRMVFFNHGLPKRNGEYGFAKLESFFDFGDEFVYASGDNGSLYRINPESGKATLMLTPTDGRNSRLSSLVKTGNGIVYGVTGRDGFCEFIKIDYVKGVFELIGEIKDKEGHKMWQCHDIVYAGHDIFYACENDNPYRSSYLWEIRL